MRNYLLVIIGFVVSLCCNANRVDSIYGIWLDENQPDSTRLEAIDGVAWHYLFIDPDTAITFARKELAFAKKVNSKYHQGEAMDILALYDWINGNYDEALLKYGDVLTIRKSINNKRGEAGCYNNMGLIYMDQGDPVHARELFTRSLEIKKEIKDKKGEANALGNIGTSYQNQGDYLRAIEYQLKCLGIMEELGDQPGKAITMTNIGDLYLQQEAFDHAEDYFTKSKAIYLEEKNRKGLAAVADGMGKIHHNRKNFMAALSAYAEALGHRREMGDRKGEAKTLNNMGECYEAKGQLSQAMEYHKKALVIQKEIEVAGDIAVSYFRIGMLMNSMKKPEQALVWCEKGLDISIEQELMMYERDMCKCMYEAHRRIGNQGAALKYYEKYITLKDSLLSKARIGEIARRDFQYEFDRKMAADSIHNAELRKVTAAQLKAKDAQMERDRVFKWSLGVFLALIAAFAVFVISRLRVSQKQAKLIAEQKLEVEEKNKEVLDSINYARRLQDAILPPTNTFHSKFKDAFILYKPKDIVAGDFYWMEETADELLFAVADCTGHGVPGAMVSVVCSNALNESFKELNTTDPGAILTKTRDLLVKRFESSEHEISDGMDIALCTLNKKAGTVKYAGANNSMYYMNEDDLQEVKADKQPIGQHITTNAFTTKEIPLTEGMRIYLFTDGYPDQFGGDSGKKFKYTPFKELISSVSDMSFEDQKLTMDETFEKWRRDHEQIDDVCVIGVRV